MVVAVVGAGPGYRSGMFFQDWPTLARTLVVAPLAYLTLLLAVRVSGKRTLAKLNAFDLVVTVALGSVLASLAVSPDVTLADGAVAFTLLIALQYAIAVLSARVPRFRPLIKARPTLLLSNGALREQAMAEQRVARPELLQVLRQHGVASVEQAAAVVLETDGTLSVLRDGHASGETSTLADVDGWS